MTRFKLKDGDALIWLYMAFSVMNLFHNLPIQYVRLSFVLLAVLSLCFLMKTVSVRAQSASVIKFKNGIYICTFLMIFSTAVHIGFWPDNYGLVAMSTDMISLLTYLYATTLIGSKFDNKFPDYLLAFGIISAICGLYALMSLSLSVQTISDRYRNASTTGYYIYCASEFWPILPIYTIINWKNTNHRKLFAIISVAISVVNVLLSFLFLKRVIFVAIIGLMIVVFLALRRHMTRVLKLSYVVILCIIVLLICLQFTKYNISELFHLTIDRFANEDIADFDRWIEFKNLFHEFGSQFLILGMGIGSFHSGPGGVNLHLGILNFLFKGGLPFFVLMLINFRKCLHVLVAKIPLQYKAFPAYAMFTCIYSCISPLWASNPSRLLFSFSLIKSLVIYDELHSGEIQRIC